MRLFGYFFAQHEYFFVFSFYLLQYMIKFIYPKQFFIEIFNACFAAKSTN